MAMDNQPSALSLIMRLIFSPLDDKDVLQQIEEREVKVLQRTRVSHLLKTISPEFGGYIEKDFEPYLIRPDMEIPLNSSCRLSDYQCKNLDVIELRRKEQLITLAVNIFADEVRNFEVNASLPVSEIVKFIGKELGVENTKELSLAFPSASEKNGVSISCMNWLDVTRSLNAQGIENGDKVLLRKKFFIINEDIQEAEQNHLLKNLILHQLHTQLTHKQENRKISTEHSNTTLGSDQESLSEDVMIGSPGLIDSVIQAAFESSSNSSEIASDEPKTEECKEKEKDIMATLSKHHSQFAAQFKVTVSEEENISYLCCQSTAIFLCKEPKVTENSILKKWSINELMWEKVDNGLKLGLEDESQIYSTEQTTQIIEYLSHMKSIIMEKESPSHFPLKVGTSSCSSTPISSPMKKKTSITLSMLSTSTSESQSSDHSNAIVEEAGIGQTTFDQITVNNKPTEIIIHEDSPTPVVLPTTPVLSPSHKPKSQREKKISITPPSYFGKEFNDLTDHYILLHINVLDQEIRPILVNIDSPVRLIIRDICATFEIQYPDEHYLRVPTTVEEIIKTYGGKPKSQTGGSYTRRNSQILQQTVLNEDVSLFDQMDLEMRPYVFVLKRRGFDETDSAEKHGLDIGQEWPEGEDPGVARYRRFYQSWMGVVQGDYPITKSLAIKFAGLLAYIYFGSKSNSPFWPPLDFDVTRLLPEKFHDVHNIKKEVLKAHQENEGISLNQAIDSVIQLCQEMPSSTGLYFRIKVPSSSAFRKRMETRIFGLRPQGLVCFQKGLQHTCWDQAYTDIQDWAIASSSFRLKFNNDNVSDFYAFSYQARQIMEMMQTYVKMQYKTASKKKEIIMSDV